MKKKMRSGVGGSQKRQKRQPLVAKLKGNFKSKDGEIASLHLKNEELTEMLQRLQADFENFRKRAEREIGETSTRACGRLLLRLLPLLDSFDSSLTHQERAEAIAEGFKHIHKQFKDVLRSVGVESMETVGKPFDPVHHEVLIKENSNQDRNIILEELQKGYYYKEKVLRHAKVKVSAGPEEE